MQQNTWTATGMKESITYPDSSKVTYGYDQLDRLKTVTDAFDRTTQYNYNPVGSLVETLLPNGSKTNRDYDYLYRITAMTQQDPTGKITDSYQYGYDPAGNKTLLKKSKTDEDELHENEEKTFAYDALNQLVSVSEVNGDSRNYYYDTLGNRVALIEQEQNQKQATYYQYDQLNRLTRTSGHDGEIKDYSYDKRGNLTEIKSGDKIFNTYAFDAANKLTNVINKFGDSTTYTYDGLGNRIQTVIDLNQGSENHNRPIFPPGPGGPPAFVEDLKNKNPGPPPHDGNPKTGWDHQFKRDYMIQHYVMDYTKPYDNLLMSYGEHSQIQRYTYGRELISMDFIGINDHDNGWIPQEMETNYVEQWDSLYYLHDEMGTVAKVIGTSGKTSAHYNYDEFGRPLGAVKLDPNWPGPDNAVSYTGYTYDHFAELYYAQARYYLPEVGRFISSDPMPGRMAKPQTLNPYPYVAYNPLRYVDPNGHELIVVSGSEYEVPLADIPYNPYSRFKYNFIEPSIKKLRQLRGDFPEENITWLISAAGYEKDIENFKDTASKIGVSIEFISNKDELFNYINTKGSGNTAQREVDKITKFAVYSHGLPGVLALGYRQENEENTNITVNDLNSNNINRSSFDNPNSWFGSCNAGTSVNTYFPSFARTWQMHAGGRAWGAVGKTDYSEIVGNWEINKETIKASREGKGYMEEGSIEYPGLGKNAYWVQFEELYWKLSQ